MGIQGTAICKARWIKPLHMQSPGQRTAIMILGFTMREDTNTAINTGLFVEGKKVITMCGHPQNMRLMREATQNQQLSTDRRCPIFLEKVNKMNHMHQENRYKFFCTTDPSTWETVEGYNNLGAEGEEHGQRRGAFRKDNTSNYHDGGGTGRLAGGQRGRANTQRTRDNRWEGFREEVRSNRGRDA
ncbi:hypothetical protein BYT27DRAFT_7326651, partial [Phlegmacium glaucopus]